MLDIRNAMIVDCHVHLSPDNVADKNLEHMTRTAGFRPACKGTVDDLLNEMRRAGISKSLVNNIVGDPKLVRKANDWTARIVSENTDRLFGIGWIHPLMERPEDEVERCIRELGFKGIKLHFSNTRVLPYDPRVSPIYAKSQKLGIPLLVHSGPNVEDLGRTDFGDAVTQYSRPSNFEKVLEEFPSLRLILAHLAGAEHFKAEAFSLLEKYPALLLDTALGQSGTISKIVSHYGASRVLLGSDYPVVRPGDAVKIIATMPLTENEKTAILCDNAAAAYDLI